MADRTAVPRNMAANRLGIVIPAYNAAATLRTVIQRIPSIVWKHTAQVWIINDGSRDETQRVAIDVSKTKHRLSVIEHAENRGYGAAVKTGMSCALKAKVGWVACLHADGQYAPERLPELMSQLQQRELDLIQGSRIASGTALSGGMPVYKYVANRLLTTMENRLFGLTMTDYHSGMLLYGRRALQQIPFRQLSDSFDFDLEVIASARALGLAVGEHPIPTHYGDEISYLNPLTYGMRVLGVMLRYKLGCYGRS